MPHAIETLAALRKRGADIAFLTNNSSLTRSGFAERLRGFGFDAQPAEVFGSADTAAHLCLQQNVQSAFVIGENGLYETLTQAGVSVRQESANVDAVIAGICRSFSYSLLSQAMRRIREGARFIATNTDATYPVENGLLEPGAGAIVAAIEVCSGVKPQVAGKPEPLMVQMAMAEAGVSAPDTLIIGDRMETDIACGIAAGCDTLLVLNGVSNRVPQGQACCRDLQDLLT